MTRTISTKPLDNLVHDAIRAETYDKEAVVAQGDSKPQKVAKKWSAGMARHFRRRFADRMKTMRQQAGLSLQELGRRACVDHSQLVRLESGERSCTLETAVKIAGALGVSLGLLTDEDSQTSMA